MSRNLRELGYLSAVLRRSPLAALVVLLAFTAAAQPQKEEKSNMQLVGYSDLQARSSYQPTIHQQGQRWIAYIGLAIVLYVACDMIWRGAHELWPYLFG